MVWSAWQLQQAGKLAEARVKYEQALTLEPNQPDALHMLGVIADRAGRYELAADYFERAIRSAPGNAGMHSNYGLTLKELGRVDDAIAHFDHAITLKPDFADAHLNRGIALKALGRTEEALASYDRAMACNPRLAAGHYNRSIALQEAGKLDEALASYDQAIAIQPTYASALANRGYVLMRRGRFIEALADYDKAISLRPGKAEDHSGRGNVLKELKRPEDAVASQNRAIALKPGYAEAYASRAMALLDLGCREEALADCEHALKLAPELAAAHSVHGMLLQHLNRVAEAVASYAKAFALAPDNGFAYSSVIHLRSQLIDWSALDADLHELPALMEQAPPGFTPFTLLSLPDAGARMQKKAARDYAANALKDFHEPPLVEPAAWRPRQRLRIGYLSADIYGHATVFLLAGVLDAHDRDRVEIWMYAYGPPPATEDPNRRRVAAACEHFRDLHELSDLDAARCIANDEIDILIDLKGYTKDYRMGITARRPAPLIVSWLGYPGTLGYPLLADYIIGDATVTPPESADDFSETLALMPHCYQPNDHGRSLGAPPSRFEAGLPETGFIFCSFNQTYKINPAVFSLWCRLLASVPDSVLWLLKQDETAIANLRAEAVARSVDPDRLIFAPLATPADHLARLQLADLALDTFPYTSHTTGSDALWAGVPLVSRIGDTFASRVAASLLRAIDLPDLVAENEEAYFDLCLRLATNRHFHSAIKERLQRQRTTAPLFDTQRFARDLERMYHEMWARQASGERGPIVLRDTGSVGRI